MSSNCFIRQEATVDILKNVASFCSECYRDILQNETIFYDMQNCRYLCASCQVKIEEKLNSNAEAVDLENNSLFN